MNPYLFLIISVVILIFSMWIASLLLDRCIRRIRDEWK